MVIFVQYDHRLFGQKEIPKYKRFFTVCNVQFTYPKSRGKIEGGRGVNGWRFMVMQGLVHWIKI